MHFGEEVNCVGEMFGHMSDQNVKLAGHVQNLVGQCPMTDCYFQLSKTRTCSWKAMYTFIILFI